MTEPIDAASIEALIEPHGDCHCDGCAGVRVAKALRALLTELEAHDPACCYCRVCRRITGGGGSDGD